MKKGLDTENVQILLFDWDAGSGVPLERLWRWLKIIDFKKWTIGILKMTLSDTVDGRNPAPVDR